MKPASIYCLFLYLSFAVLLAGCSVLAKKELNERFGQPSVQARVVPRSELTAESVDYWMKVKPILDNRCSVCHACYDAPCQFKTTSVAGFDRGASKTSVYNATRLLPGDPSRLFVDALDTQAWRDKGFYPVLNERAQSEDANLEASVLYRILRLKEQNPLPRVTRLSPDEFDFSLDRVNECPTIEEFDWFEKRHPQWGMPFGFPPIPEQELAVLVQWIREGGRVSAQPSIGGRISREVEKWEVFLNGDSPKQRLMARFIFEHIFLADLTFERIDSRDSFRLIRSFTPPGVTPSPVATRRPTDDPGVSRVFYRLVRSEETPIAKTRLPYVLSDARLERYRTLFLNEKYHVETLPGYSKAGGVNPFRTFQQIPVKSRYKFLLDDSLFYIQGFIKGPVCRGQVALNVINDQFWVIFVDPDRDPTVVDDQFLHRESDKLFLPASGDDNLVISGWLRFKQQEKDWLAAKRKHLARVGAGKGASLDFIWRGPREFMSANATPAISIFRHFNSATAMKGFVGDVPETAWVMGFPLLERMHYLLAVDFDVYGTAGHQLLTRLYMDFLRGEGENNFLLLLPKSKRVELHDSWYRGLGAEVGKYGISPENFDFTETQILFSREDVMRELFEKLRVILASDVDRSVELNRDTPSALHDLAAIRGSNTAFMPELSLLRVRKGQAQDELYSIVLNRAHKNVAMFTFEDLRLEPENNTLSVIRGVVGAYPNAFFVVDESDLANFTDQVRGLRKEDDYRALLDRFAIRRTNPEFWSHSDWFQQAQQRYNGKDAGLLDYSRFENR